MAKPQPVHGRVLVPKDSFSLPFQGASYSFSPGDLSCTVEEGHPIVKGREHLFEVLIPAYAVDANVERWETATAGPGEVRGA